MQLSFAESWMTELETKLEDAVGQLDDQARALIQLTARFVLEGQREGLVELI